MKLLDSCFLIDLQRELRRGEKLGAEDYLKKHTREEFGISTVSITEFLEGFELSEDGEKFLRPFRWLSVNAAVAREASRIGRQLRLKGNLIGDFDILIAATALTGDVSLVTRDPAHFQQIEGLRVETYGADDSDRHKSDG